MYNNFKIALKKIRRINGFSQNGFSDIIKINVNTIKSWETGRSIPSPDMWLRLQVGLDINGLAYNGFELRRAYQDDMGGDYNV